MYIPVKNQHKILSLCFGRFLTSAIATTDNLTPQYCVQTPLRSRGGYISNIVYKINFCNIFDVKIVCKYYYGQHFRHTP